MAEGQTMHDIDECDFFFLLDLIVYRENREHEQTREPETTVDALF